MKQFLELVPIVLFFVVYQMDGQTISLGDFQHQVDGIFTATGVLIIATAIQLVLTRLITGHLEKRLLILFATVLGFGGATLIFRNELFIQWKPTIFNWALALGFLASQFIGNKKTLIERALGSQIELPKFVWSRLNTMWVSYFIVVGALNLAVAYNFSEAFWVSYKLYSAIGFTILITVITAMIIMPHINEDSDLTQEK